MNERITVYRANSRHDLNIWETWVVMANNIGRSGELIYQMLVRDLTAEYKKSFIGVAWIILSPLLSVISWVFLHSTGLFSPGDIDIPYPLYVLVSTSFWGLFLGFYRSTSKTLDTGKDLITQMNFFHEVFIVEKVLLEFVNFLVVLAINFIVLISFGIPISFTTIFLPLLLIPLALFGSAIGMLVSMLEVVAIDVSKFVDFGVSLLLLVTPIIYSPTIEDPAIQSIIRLNPLTYLIGAARDVMLTGAVTDWGGFIFSSLLALALFLMAVRIFFVAEIKLIERLL